MQVGLCRNKRDVHSHAELLKVDVEINVQLVAAIYLYPLYKTVDDHFLCLKACSVVYVFA
jgi:hypothetical protein